MRKRSRDLPRSDKPSGSISAEDVELQRRIVNYLHLRLPTLDAIEVDAYHGMAILRGTVPSLSIRSRCVDCCRIVAGVLNVTDRLVVLPAYAHPDALAAASSRGSVE